MHSLNRRLIHCDSKTRGEIVTKFDITDCSKTLWKELFSKIHVIRWNDLLWNESILKYFHFMDDPDKAFWINYWLPCMSLIAWGTCEERTFHSYGEIHNQLSFRFRPGLVLFSIVLMPRFLLGNTAYHYLSCYNVIGYGT